MILTLCNFHRERKPDWLQHAKTLSMVTQYLLPLISTCRCSWMKEWNSASAGSTFDALAQPRSTKPSSNCPKCWKAEYSSPPMMILIQKQLMLCPIGERAATVEVMVLTKSSRKRRQSLRKSFRRKRLFISSRDKKRRVPSKNCSSSMAPKHEHFENMYASHFSMTCKSLLGFIFRSKHYTNREN